MVSSGERTERSALSAFVTALEIAVVAGALSGVALAVAIGAIDHWGVSRDVAVLAGYLSALYATVYGIGLGVTALAAAALGVQLAPRALVGLLLGFLAFLNGALRFTPAVQLAGVIPSLNAIGAIDLAAITAGSVAVFAAIATRDRRLRVASLAVAAVSFVGMDVLHRWHERPLRRDLSALVPELIAQAPRDSEPAAAQFANARVVVLGFDGLTWENLLPLMRRGELPHFQALLRDAAYGHLDTLQSTFSPVVWETISTGRTQDQHGIGHHVHIEFPGLRRRVAQLPTMPLCNAPMGLRRLLVYTAAFAPWNTVQVSALDARAARVWEIAAKAGLTIGLYDWYNSAPVPALPGFLHGSPAMMPIVSPPDLERAFAPLPPEQDLDPRTRRPEDEGVSERERALWQRFVALAQAHHPDLLMYYTHYGDGANHLNWKLETLGDGLFFSGWSHPEYEPGPMITNAHRLFDEIVGDVLRRVPEDATVIVVSDHGFDFRGYEHDNAPPGVLILRGPRVEPGVFEGATVYDVAPTLLHLLVIPPARDMPGAVVRAVGGKRAERVASYGGPVSAEHTGGVDEEALARQREYLRSLGYVVD